MKNRNSRMRALLALVFSLLCFAVPVHAAEQKKDPDEWRQLAEKGDAEAQFQYAELLGNGQGVPRDEFESVRLLRKAADQGHARAQTVLGMRYKSGRGIPQDIVEAVVWVKKGAENGDMNAQTTLALCYATGDGTPKNEVAAAKLLERAIKAGSRFAESTLSSMQLRGSPKDDAEAATAYKQAARTGDATAQIAYAACLDEGRGVPKNPVEAAKWYLLAAKKGDLLAKYRLGLVQQATAETQAEAYEWLAIAGIEGIGAARTAADGLEKKLTPEQLAAARIRVKERAKPPEVAKADAPGGEADKAGGAGMRRVIGRTPNSSGTGFFISEDGYLVTNHHVVDGGRRFEIQRGETKIAAKVIRTSAPNDLAVLKVEGEFPALEIEGSDGVALGDAVLTVGFPMTNVQGLSPKLSRGEIGSLKGMRDDPTRFQVSLPLQHGNSGGALVNKDGRVIGVVNSGLAFGQAVNYAVKSKHLLELLNDIPDAKKRLPKPVENRGSTSPIKQTEAASVIIWVYAD